MPWRRFLAEQRRARKLTRPQLASLSNVSVATLRAYESGHRNPPRVALVAILDALQLPPRERNLALAHAGFAPEGPRRADGSPNFLYSLDDAQAYVDSRPWPAAVVIEIRYIVWANPLWRRLFVPGPIDDFKAPLRIDRLGILSDPLAQERIQNWEQVAQVAVSLIKGTELGYVTDGRPNDGFAEFVQRLPPQPALMERLEGIWNSSPPQEPKILHAFPLDWLDPDVGLLRFELEFFTANEAIGIDLNNWIPRDAATWLRLEQLRAIGSIEELQATSP